MVARWSLLVPMSSESLELLPWHPWGFASPCHPWSWGKSVWGWGHQGQVCGVWNL